MDKNRDIAKQQRDMDKNRDVSNSRDADNSGDHNNNWTQRTPTSALINIGNRSVNSKFSNSNSKTFLTTKLSSALIE